MNLFEVSRSERYPVYQKLASDNGLRQYDFLRSMIESALATGKYWVSHDLIKALNFHAIVGLHPESGQYRPYNVDVKDNQGNAIFIPPQHYRVESLMDDCVNEINYRLGSQENPTPLAAYTLWRINNIHPFVNGNGRTARALCYFILCVKSGDLLPGSTILPELLRRDPIRAESISAMKEADDGNLDALNRLIARLITQQLSNM